MNTRFSAAALIAAGLVSFASPSSAQEVRTFSAWGHEFIVPGSLSAAPAEHGAARAATSTSSARRAYTSAGAAAVSEAPAARPQATRTINVWGARLTVPAE